MESVNKNDVAGQVHDDSGDGQSPKSARVPDATCAPEKPVVPTTKHQNVIDGLATWDKELPVASAQDLSLVRLDQNERLVIPFTMSMVRVRIHYLESAAVHGYVHCNGEGCVLCQVGRQVDERDLLPVYDPIAKAVAVLSVSPNLRPHALRPQVAPILKAMRDGSRAILAIRRIDPMRFKVNALPLPDGADDGAGVIKDFLRHFDQGEIDLRSVYLTIDNAELKNIPEIAMTLKLKGGLPTG